MADNKGKEKRGRRRAGGLRKHQHIENVVVEESFGLLNSSEKAGDGVYVSATTANNKRYYGVLIDQPALKEATSLWLKDQASSLDLNRRIRVLEQQNTNEVSKETDGKSSAGAETSAASYSALGTPSEQSCKDTAETVSESRGIDVRASTTTKRSLEGEDRSEEVVSKRTRLDETTAPDTTTSGVAPAAPSKDAAPLGDPLGNRPVQKFRYTCEKSKTPARNEKTDPGYRVLVATFSSIEEAADGDLVKSKDIEAACEEGGNFLPGNNTYYYQYEVPPTTLTLKDSTTDFDLRTSMGFHSFMLNTPLPPWYPLSNLQVRQAKVLNMLSMKRDNKGNVTWDNTVNTAAVGDAMATDLAGGTQLSMQARPKRQYQIGVVGGGIAGLACCQELVASLENDGIDAQVTLLEARPRFGGRLWTDRSFLPGGETSVPIELGASWIHGIEDNPLATLAKEAGIDFATSSEEVQMLGANMQRMDSVLDERTGQLFDDLLDHAADDCWSAQETAVDNKLIDGQDPQAAVRWYSSVFVPEKKTEDNQEGASKNPTEPQRMGAPTHRRSSDRSIDFEMGKAIAKHKLREASKLSADEHRMLLWNTKNVEYALGANISDLSMKYWDADERHAFEGDHVLLKQGYSTVVQHMVASLRRRGKQKFEEVLDFQVGKVEYARKSTTMPYGRDRLGRDRKLVELSDACSVTSQDGTKTRYFDFIVCTVPLGVLKESVQRAGDVESTNKLSFQPCLPFSKVDAITNVGFGLLDKVYLHFPHAFWRQAGLFKESDQFLFGNVSGVTPHHYMFFDIGQCLGSGEDPPAVLMSLVSGREAVACERMSDKELLDEVMGTLRTLFSASAVPEPTSFRFTRWGQDQFSRGSYTFLPPGATDQDFQLLQSPINGNGDSLLLEGSETMRLFFAGEHTTALHPSMAHGAMLSGMRAAKELVATLQFKQSDEKDVDRVIPVALFRHKNPTTELRCSLCHKVGGQVREGSLLAFKRGARQVLVHNNCAEFSPEVEVLDSKWKYVVKAVNRGKAINCSLCKESGATMGCSAANCYRVFHFSCSEDTGWRFDRDGKVFYCDMHRQAAEGGGFTCDRISLPHFLTKNPVTSLKCALCKEPEAPSIHGPLLAFQMGGRRACVHEKCIKYTTIVDTAEDEDSRMGHEYRNVFRALDEARTCSSCEKSGASVGCTEPSCTEAFHAQCAARTGWNFEKRGKLFKCRIHRKASSGATKNVSDGTKDKESHNGLGANDQDNGSTGKVPGFLQHNLLAQFGATPVDKTQPDTPSNLGTGDRVSHSAPSRDEDKAPEGSSDSEDTEGDNPDPGNMLDSPISHDFEGAKQLVRMERSSHTEKWQISLKVVSVGSKVALIVAAKEAVSGKLSSVKVGDKIVSFNGSKVGLGDWRTLRDILAKLKEETDLMLEVIRT